MDFEIAVYVQASTEAEDVPEKLKDHDTAIAVVRCSDAPANHNRSRIECPDRAVPSGPSATTRPGGHHDHPLNEQANQATPPRHVGGFPGFPDGLVGRHRRKCPTALKSRQSVPAGLQRILDNGFGLRQLLTIE
jgi:hypothetical protein